MKKNLKKFELFNFLLSFNKDSEKARPEFFIQKPVIAANCVTHVGWFWFLLIFSKNMNCVLERYNKKEELPVFHVAFYFLFVCNCLLFAVSTHLADNSFCFLSFSYIYTLTSSKMLIQKSQFHHKSIWFAVFFVHMALPHCHGMPLSTSIHIRI